jgi:hypothetical protein
LLEFDQAIEIRFRNQKVIALPWFAIARHYADIRSIEGIFLLYSVHRPLHTRLGDMIIGW